MQVTVNDNVINLEQEVDLEKLFKNLSIDISGSAIAINQEIVPRPHWSTKILQDGDNISFFKMIAGG